MGCAHPAQGQGCRRWPHQLVWDYLGKVIAADFSGMALEMLETAG